MKDTFEYISNKKVSNYIEHYMVIRTIFPIILECGMTMKCEETMSYEKYLEFRKFKMKYIKGIFRKSYEHFRMSKEIEIGNVDFEDLEGSIFVEVYETEFKRDNKKEEYIFNLNK